VAVRLLSFEVELVNGSTASVPHVSGADDDDDDVATMMMNSDMHVMPVDADIARGNPTKAVDVVEAGMEDDGTASDGGGDCCALPSECQFFVSFDANQTNGDDIVEQVTEYETGPRHQDTDAKGDTIESACLDNSGDSEHGQVTENPAFCSEEEEDPGRHDGLESEVSALKASAVDQDTLLGCEMCSDDDDDNDNDNDNENDGSEQFFDAECEQHEAYGDTVSDSVSFEQHSHVVGEELPESQSDSMLFRLPIRLDAVQELPDSSGEDVVTDSSAGVGLLAISPVTSSPTSPNSVSSLAVSEQKSPVSSPDSSGKPPAGAAAVVLRMASRGESNPAADDSSPKSPEYAIVHDQKVEFRPPKMTSATKRVSSFRKSLIK